ncbi:6-carboxytetrahydropterin synthase QueD [Mergibacter septicus]|uniref:6-carboxy-5,6,7,8-tetrahydropterin synthase n=1 Tax=Mergibacter septicus TaxID=221402 RepID=A0A8E3MC96_9PAST|nr:6-carboxytetrahydropterin synthase QueD [Mergibacter septicus]AWX15107.1 6-carboxytetrahydropterin synthase QueD [Mergibacter septicus]QDJ12625.1 6-carboxytetrahydropterin synthase QueD [Mergibacter septicus]QDJ14360.1 6-carboxytetrahydropterin synthase QueD [Mergibacter septicus]UTU48199.1 6-carboxytetrahydropterin synthase QueD [Mergibacter septicus]WMR96182.1 6-carboxytetrahydropterin synthase QueD [Mergibacter septicus]
MIKISKEFSFDMAHLLDGHDGKCQNLHGHTYKLQVELTGKLHTTGAKRGMVMDFSDVKKAVKELIIDQLDHAFIYDKFSERECKIAQLLESMQLKTFALETRTTAEEMARFIFNQLKTKANLPISSVRLWETPTSYCEYKEISD